MTDAQDPIQGWHDYMKSKDPDVLAGVLADDVVFESPVVT